MNRRKPCGQASWHQNALQIWMLYIDFFNKNFVVLDGVFGWCTWMVYSVFLNDNYWIGLGLYGTLRLALPAGQVTTH